MSIKRLRVVLKQSDESSILLDKVNEIVNWLTNSDKTERLSRGNASIGVTPVMLIISSDDDPKIGEYGITSTGKIVKRSTINLPASSGKFYDEFTEELIEFEECCTIVATRGLRLPDTLRVSDALTRFVIDHVMDQSNHYPVYTVYDKESGYKLTAEGDLALSVLRDDYDPVDIAGIMKQYHNLTKSLHDEDPDEMLELFIKNIFKSSTIISDKA